MKRTMIATWLSTGCILLTTGLWANAQQVNTIVGNVVNPERRDVSEALIDQLKLPAGFEISVFASGLGNPRMMAFGNDGTLYVTRRSQDRGVGSQARSRHHYPRKPPLLGYTQYSVCVRFAAKRHIGESTANGRELARRWTAPEPHH